jgi:hypothetical protein
MISEQEFKELKLGTIVEDSVDVRSVLIYKTDTRLGIYEYISGCIKIFDFENAKKLLNVVKDLSVMNLVSNNNKNVAASTVFINEAIKLFINNPHIYHKAFKNYQFVEKDFAYFNKEELVIDKLIKNKNTDKTYTIIDAKNISDEIYLIIERYGSVLGEFMEYEKLCIRKKDFDENWVFVNDVMHSNDDEPLYLFTDDEIKKLFQPEPPKKKPKSKFNSLIYDIMEVKNLDNIIKLTPDPNREYLDVFTGGLHKGEHFSIISPHYNQYIEINEIKDSYIKYNKYQLNKVNGKDSIDLIHVDGTMTDLELYTLLWLDCSTEYACKDGRNEKYTYMYTNNTREIIDDMKCIKLSDRSIKQCHDTRDGILVDDDNGKLYEMDAVTKIDINGVDTFVRQYVPLRYSGKRTELFKIGDVYILDDKTTMLLAKINKKSLVFFINFFDKSVKKITCIKISKDMLIDNPNRFYHSEILSVPALTKI